MAGCVQPRVLGHASGGAGGDADGGAGGKHGLHTLKTQFVLL